jgi:hypothetical protein
MDVLGGRSQPFDGKWNLTDGGSKLSLETPASPEPAEYIVEVVDDTRLVLKTDKVRMEFKRAD